MGAPTLVTRTLPVGFKMADGLKTTVALQNVPGLRVWELTVKPPAIDGGDPIDTTTMHNVAWRTKDAKHLKTLMPHTTKNMLDPDVISDLIAQVNINQSITVAFPDHTTLTYYGYMQKAEFSDFKEGERPEVDITWVPTNWDPVAFAEQGPVLAQAAGT